MLVYRAYFTEFALVHMVYLLSVFALLLRLGVVLGHIFLIGCRLLFTERCLQSGWWCVLWYILLGVDGVCT